jgi:hypothetical protein
MTNDPHQILLFSQEEKAMLLKPFYYTSNICVVLSDRLVLSASRFLGEMRPKSRTEALGVQPSQTHGSHVNLKRVVDPNVAPSKMTVNVQTITNDGGVRKKAI